MEMATYGPKDKLDQKVKIIFLSVTDRREIRFRLVTKEKGADVALRPVRPRTYLFFYYFFRRQSVARLLVATGWYASKRVDVLERCGRPGPSAVAMAADLTVMWLNQQTLRGPTTATTAAAAAAVTRGSSGINNLFQRPLLREWLSLGPRGCRIGRVAYLLNPIASAAFSLCARVCVLFCSISFAVFLFVCLFSLSEIRNNSSTTAGHAFKTLRHCRV